MVAIYFTSHVPTASHPVLLLLALIGLAYYLPARAVTRRRIAGAIVVLVLSCATLYAAQKPPQPDIVVTDPCSVPPVSEWPEWARWLVGCV